MADVLLTHSNHLYNDRKQARKMQPYPPLQTLVAAACLRREGYEVALFDASLASSGSRFREALERHQPRLVAVCEDNFNFLTKMCLLRNRELACWMAGSGARRPGVPAIVNGSDAADRAARVSGGGLPLRTRRRGGGRHHGGDALAAHRRRRGARIAGVAFADAQSGQIRHAPRRAPLTDLDALPVPAWDLIDAEPYREAWMRGARLFLHEYGFQPRMSVPLQLVREADLGR